MDSPTPNGLRPSFARPLPLEKLLVGYANYPAVIAYQVYVPPYGRPFQPDDASETVEDQLNLFAQHYKLQAVSVKKAVWRKAKENITGFVTHDSEGTLASRHCCPPKLIVDPVWKNKGAWLQGKLFFQDAGYHADPHTGLRLMGELAAEVLFEALTSLNSNPFSSEDALSFNASLSIPPPLVPGNWEAHGEKCFIEGKLNESTVKAGFVFTDEDRGWGKWGLLSDKPGSFVTVIFDSSLPSEEFANETAAVTIAYLKSWAEVMGKMKVECVSGCSCNQTIIDSHTHPSPNEPQFSVMLLHLIHVSQSRECKMTATVMQETSSNGHKIKILGIMASEDPQRHQWASEGGQLLNGDITAFMGRLLVENGHD